MRLDKLLEAVVGLSVELLEVVQVDESALGTPTAAASFYDVITTDIAGGVLALLFDCHCDRGWGASTSVSEHAFGFFGRKDCRRGWTPFAHSIIPVDGGVCRSVIVVGTVAFGRCWAIGIGCRCLGGVGALML